MRPSKRAPDELRRVSLERGVLKHAEGSCLVKFGDTHVLCAASLEERAPSWLKGQGRGWVTAEYSMLPRATHERTRREVNAGRPSGRTQEIQRLIGRSLRAVVDLPVLGERQITVDCDVIQADGGTRTASITGAWVALHDCLHWMRSREMIASLPLRDHVAAVSCGVVAGRAVLDLATGSGLVAVAAARAGGRPVTANDIDPLSLAAARANAEANAVDVRAVGGDLLDTEPAYGVVLAGDVFYSREMAGRMLPFLRRAAAAGALVLVGDPGRAYLPAGLIERATYDVPVSEALESVPMRRTTVWQVGR